MKPSLIAVGMITAHFVLVVHACAGVVTIELPPEPATLKPGPGAELVRAQCLTCHSSEYLSTQPRLPRTYWKGAVEKMQQKFGAPITAEQIEPLVDYLVRAYGVEPPTPAPSGR